MNKLQEFMYNEGERLVPYVSHDMDELIRHRSSYAFFHRVIQSDYEGQDAGNGPSIVDLGSGTGYGCALLASIENSTIVGVDIEEECRSFAEQYYPRTNVEYVIEDLTTYIPNMPGFDYSVSRGVLEHVPGGVELIAKIKFNKRVMVDVPYNEEPGNQHHVITGILESDFDGLKNREIFYEDLKGNIYREDQKPQKANLIMVVASDPELPRISDLFEFPIPRVESNALEVAGREMLGGKRLEFSRDELLDEVKKAIRETDVVADIGCGIVPMNYFRPKLHLMIEPWNEYADILSYRHADDKSVMVLRQDALSMLKSMSDKSVDSVFMLDVIEHIEKETGKAILVECERVAREQIVLFTPLGFMEQHMESGDKDGWGLSGTGVQEHLSGWEPDEFGPEWAIFSCNDFHQVVFKGESLPRTHGAFFAIRNFDVAQIEKPESFSDIRRKLPSETEAEALRASLEECLAQLRHREAQYEEVQQLYQQLLDSKPVRLVRRLKAIIGRP
ncbi:MAG: methyltransferase domain-containing protein [Roseobacter sp.]